MAVKLLPIVMGSIAAAMVVILGAVMFLFYRKRKESLEFRVPLEMMTRGSFKSKKKKSSSSNSSGGSLDKQPVTTPLLKDTQFWVPEVYQTIIQPSPTPANGIRKTSRLQSTLDREIYSRTQDTSYLQAAEPEVFDGDANGSGLSRRGTGSRRSKRDTKRLASGEESRGMLHFSLQYKQDRALLNVVVIKAEGLPNRKNGDLCDPFVDLQVRPYYKRRMHSEVHQKTQNPFFHQLFEFEVPPYEIRKQTVYFNVLDFSQQLAHETIGVVLFSLATLDYDAFIAGKEFALWKKIDKMAMETTDKVDGRLREYPLEMDMDRTALLLLVSISYHQVAERLTVIINKARNLLLVDRKGKLDHPYVSVSLTHFDKVLKKLRTGVVRHEINPVFNKTLIFELPHHLVEQVSLTIKLKHHVDMGIGRDRTFAVMTIGKQAMGTGSEQWCEMLSSNETVQRWHRLLPMDVMEQ